jgi:hypothetical protein
MDSLKANDWRLEELKRQLTNGIQYKRVYKDDPPMLGTLWKDTNHTSFRDVFSKSFPVPAWNPPPTPMTMTKDSYVVFTDSVGFQDCQSEADAISCAKEHAAQRRTSWILKPVSRIAPKVDVEIDTF